MSVMEAGTIDLAKIPENKLNEWRNTWKHYGGIRKKYPEVNDYLKARARVEPSMTALSAKSSRTEEAEGTPSTEDDWKKEYAKSADLQREFRSEGAYLAWKKHEARGTGRVFSNPDRLAEAIPFDESKLKLDWDGDEDLRKEFGGDFGSFTAYHKHLDKGSIGRIR